MSFWRGGTPRTASIDHASGRTSSAMKANVYKRYLLAVLLLILAFNSVDGLTLGLVLQNIKIDLHLSDTQLGFLSGIAFALFYAVMGIPLARWADRGNRITIIALTTGLWSIAVALCGFAASFPQLLLIRIFVAVGESGCIPPAHSLIADYFDRAERPRAIGTYMLGGSLSTVIGYCAAGWFNQFYGWRATFILVGAPGVLLAVLARLTLREPRLAQRMSPAVGKQIDSSARSHSSEARVPPLSLPLLPSSPPRLSEVCATLWASATFRHLLICFSLFYFFSYGFQQWQPAFFVRSYGLNTGLLGNWFAAIYGLGSFVGTYWGGALASRYAANNERLQLRALGVVFCLFGALSVCVYLAPNHYVAFVFLGLATVAGCAGNGPMFAIIQTLVPPRMRATAIALVYLVSNLIGVGFGPLAAGALSDTLRSVVGEESLRYALLALCPGYVWGAWHVWRASRSVTRDLAAAQASFDRNRTEGYLSVNETAKASVT